VDDRACPRIHLLGRALTPEIGEIDREVKPSSLGESRMILDRACDDEDLRKWSAALRAHCT
jgi:hypothetical protein